MKKKFLSALAAALSFIITLQICTSASTIRIEKRTNGEKISEYIGEASEYADFDASFFDMDAYNFAILVDFDSDDAYYAYPAEDVKPKKNIKNALYQNTAGISISSRIKINGVNVGENGMRIIDNAKLECETVLNNESAHAQKLSVILATYTDDGSLHQVKKSDIAIADSSIGIAELVYKFDAEHEKTGRLMFWDSINGMAPIKTTIDFSQSSGINAYYYDADNRLLQIDKANGISVFYTYDNMGNMLTKRISGGDLND